jgi:hypothetical protein
MLSIVRVNIELFPGWKKIKQRRISFVLGYTERQVPVAIYVCYYEKFQLQYIFMVFQIKD